MKILLPNTSKRGFGLTEIIVGLAIAVAVLVGTFASLNRYFKEGISNEKRVQAVLLAEEGMEAIRYIRDKGWSSTIDSLATGDEYYLEYATSTGWSAVSDNPGYILGEFKRSFVLKDVYRDDTTDDIVSSTSPDSSIDEGTRKAVILVAWKDHNSTSTITMESYITNIFDE